jgi:hypothetical protein
MSTPSVPQAVDSDAAPRRLQSLLFWGIGAPDVHVSLVASGGQGPTPVVAEARGSAPEQSRECIAAVEAVDRSAAAPELAGSACNPRAGLIGPPGEEVLGVLQNVRCCPRIPHRGFFYLCCLLTSIPSSRRYADTDMLSLAPLKRLAQSARVVPSEPRPQPACAELLPAQVEELLPMATAVEESGAPPPPVIEVEESGAPPLSATATTVEEGGRPWSQPSPKR